MLNLFSNPVLLVLLAVVPACAAFVLYAYVRRRQAITQLGNALPLRKSVLVNRQARLWKTVCVLVGITLLAIACAGPQWGIDKSAHFRKGRDVFIVLDLSRSMLAEQPSRRTLAVRSLMDVADTFEMDGGHRVALVGFASKARLFFPLTQDCDHLRHTLTQIDAGDYAPLSTEEPISGTRIGAALTLAVSLCDAKRTHRPIIVLLSDGDDPASDNEWLNGVNDAKAKQIRLHTIGFGNAQTAETIPLGRDVLHFDGKPILTKLNEDQLREIARQTAGQYLPAGKDQSIQLGAYLQHLFDADELHAAVPTDDALPVYQLRYAWFLMPAVLLLALTLLLNEGPRHRREPLTMATKAHPARSQSKVVFVALIAVSIACISAADPPSVDSLLRQGNQAFAAEKYEAALKYYEDAESLTLDPGLVSFNKAATLYRLDRYKEAIDCYRRALRDDEAPSDRKARAYFDLGNALVQQADDRAGPLAEAVAAYRACLHQAALPAKLRDDARHNLEVAQLRWLKAKPKVNTQEKTPEGPPKKGPIKEKDPNKSDEGYKLVEVEPDKKKSGPDDVAKGRESKKLQTSGITVLEDDNKLQTMSPQDALSTLERHAQRIVEERRRLRNPAGPAFLSTKDW